MDAVGRVVVDMWTSGANRMEAVEVAKFHIGDTVQNLKNRNIGIVKDAGYSFGGTEYNVLYNGSESPLWEREVNLRLYGIQKGVEGVGPDAPTITTEQGGKHSASPYRFDLVDAPAMFEMTKVLAEGAEKYGDDNWRLIPVRDHLNHLLVHAYAYLAGDKSDNHLSHMMCRAMFAVACELEASQK